MTPNEIAGRLKNAGIESAENDAALLINRFLGIPRSRLVLMKNEELDDCPGLERAVERRAAREPLQYIPLPVPWSDP